MPSGTVARMDRHTMRKVREILRLHDECKLSQRQISASTGVSKGAISEYLKRARSAGLTWEQARTLDDATVEQRLFRHRRPQSDSFLEMLFCFLGVVQRAIYRAQIIV